MAIASGETICPGMPQIVHHRPTLYPNLVQMYNLGDRVLYTGTSAEPEVAFVQAQRYRGRYYRILTTSRREFYTGGRQLEHIILSKTPSSVSSRAQVVSFSGCTGQMAKATGKVMMSCFLTAPLPHAAQHEVGSGIRGNRFVVTPYVKHPLVSSHAFHKVKSRLPLPPKRTASSLNDPCRGDETWGLLSF